MGQLYKHFKGHIYEFVMEARSADDPSKYYVVYADIEGTGVWCRDSSEFFGVLEDGTRRFTPIWIPGVDEKDDE